LAQRVGTRTHHARERRRHLGAQRDRSIALVREVVELSDDLVAALPRVELERLERWPVVFDEAEAARDVAPRLEDEAASSEFVGVEISETGKSTAASARAFSH